MPKPSKPSAAKAAAAILPVVTCVSKRLRPELRVAAALRACEINPQNNAPVRRLAGLFKGFKPTREHIALVTSKYWGPQGVDLSVSFLENRPAALRTRILAHMNAWALEPRPGMAGANVRFRETQGTGEVRIAFQGGKDGGYWSYVGTDITSIELDQPTLNLERFSMQTPEREFIRVVRHEAGHTLGFPHEHMRRELVQRINRDKAIEYFGRTQDWSPEDVDAQVLTPLEESSIMGTERADDRSIMCYDIPPEITVDGLPIVGGDDIDIDDYTFAGGIYPPTSPPQAPLPPGPVAELPPPGGGGGAATVEITTGGTRITVSVPGGGGVAKGAVRALRAPAAPLDPRPAVHECILNAGATEPFSASASMTAVNADPGAVQACVNGVFVIHIIVTGADTENSIVTKVRNALS